MNIKVSSLKSKLTHSDNFSKKSLEFIESIANVLNNPITFSEIDDYDCDLKLIFVETGGSEGLFLKNIDKLKEPYYLLTNGGNNSLAASLEILTYLSLNDKKGEILHGDISYLANRIRELSTVSKALNELKNIKLGVIGKPSDWLISSVPAYELIKNKLGISLFDIPLNIVEEKARNVSFLPRKIENKGFDKAEIDKAETVYYALKDIVNEYQLNGLTIRCFDLLTSLKRTGCLALALLNDEGIVSTCEGDIMAMISMEIVKSITDEASFQANPSRIDVLKNEIVLAHCTIPLTMTTSYRYDTHFESGISVAIKGELKEEEITIFRLSSNLKDYFVSTGKILNNMDDKNLCRTQIRVKLDSDVSVLLKKPCGNHHIICYGNHKDEIEELMKQLLK